MALRFKNESATRCYGRPVIFRQLLDDDLGCASYLVGDESEGVAIAVDPPYAIEPLVAEAERHGTQIVRTLETHTHADHVSGHGRLALEHGVPVSIHSAADVEYGHHALADGDEIEVGAVRIRVVHTPGHRPEHCAFAVVDTTRGTEPWLVLTGDSLFVGDAARPDLAVAADEGADGLFHSLHRLAELGDGVEVFPGHVAGSLCGAAMSSKPSTTIGFERRFNHALLISEQREFVATLTATLPPRPPNMERIVELNRGPFLGAPPPLRRLAEVPGGVVVIDVRDVDSFAAGHVPGALSVPVDGGSFATRAGFVLPLDTPLVLHGDSEQVERAASRLRSVGFLELAGFVVDPPADERLAMLTVDEAQRLFAAGDVELVDVREASERDHGSIPGSTSVPFSVVRDAAEDGLSQLAKPAVVICESGARAAVAASVLAAAGIDARPVVHGGVGTWPR
jgi:glyoxylase-like metal-dependent hydrolase (beta-lactamase superfamily II)/rhodanese-related sulfurtransferase